MRNLVSLVVLVAIFAVGSLNIASAATTWKCPEEFEGQTLKIYNWADYVADTTISDFEEACGVTVEYNEYSSNEDLLTVMRTGVAEYDIIVPTINFMLRMGEEGLLLELDHARIPNLGNLQEIFSTLPTETGYRYGVPYLWGTLGVAYDKNVVDEPLTSWADFFAYDGRVAWIAEPRAMMGIALTMLGYDPSTTDEAEINEAADWLLNEPNNEVFEIAKNTSEQLLLRGEVDAIIGTSGYMTQIMLECECDDFVYVLPSDGIIPFYNAMSIPASAPNPDLAYLFIDYVLDPQVGADLSNAVGFATPNAQSLPLIDPELRENGISYPTREQLTGYIVVKDVGADALQIYTDAWSRVRAELTNQ